MSFSAIDWSELSLQIVITFGHFLWQGLVVALLLVLFEYLKLQRQVLRSDAKPGKSRDGSRRSANVAYVMACIAFFALPCCVAATFYWVHQTRGSILVALSASESTSATGEAVEDDAAGTAESTPMVSAERPPALPEKKALEIPVTKTPSQPRVEPEFWSTTTQSIKASSPYLCLAYLVGVAWMLGRFGLSLVGGARLQRTLEPIADTNVLAMISTQATKLGLRRIPLVAMCKRVNVPAVVGILQPVILLPPALLSGLDPQQLAAILTHELAHIRRHDLIVNLLQRVVEALLFFHPVTWWISRRVRVERENCCDDYAADSAGRLEYAGALLQMAELCIGRNRGRLSALATLSADGGSASDFAMRVRRLIDTDYSCRLSISRRGLAGTAAMASLLFISILAWGQTQVPENHSISVLATLPHSYGLNIELVDDISGQPIKDGAVLYKEDESTWSGDGESAYETDASWEIFRTVEGGETTQQVKVSRVHGLAHLIVIATGYEPVKKKLNEKLERGKPITQTIRMKPVAPIEMTIVQPDGTPASEATFEPRDMRDFRHALRLDSSGVLRSLLPVKLKADKRGVAIFPRPAFGEWASYRIEHASGHVDLNIRDIPVSADRVSASKHRVELLGRVTIEGRYLPQVGKNEFLEICRLQPTRFSVDGSSQRVELDQDGRFSLPSQLAGWHSFSHRAETTDRKGNRGISAIASFGPFELHPGEKRTLTLGEDGASVIGKLVLPPNVRDHVSGLKIQAYGGGNFVYPHEPHGLDEQASLDWWTAYWASPAGRDHDEYGLRNRTIPVASDGSFRFPMLPPGRYELRASREGHVVSLSLSELVIADEQRGTVIDLGDLMVEIKEPSDDPEHGENHDHNHTRKTVRWIPARPLKTTVSSGSARILDDNSVGLEENVTWQEVNAHFAFDKPTTVDELRLELLPVDTPSGPQLGRGGEQLLLFDVKAGVEKQTGEWKSRDFSSCISLLNPDDQTTIHCIDYLSDTGWTVPALPADIEAHTLVLKFDESVTLQPGERLTLTVDSGGSKEVAVFNRIRFAFHQAATETGTFVLHAIDADTGKPIRDVEFVKENAVAEDWAMLVGKSDADGTVSINTKPLPGYFFSILPVPKGYKVSSLDEVPVHVEVGRRVDYRFQLRKLGTNLEFANNMRVSNATGNRFDEALKETNQKSLRIIVNDMPGFRDESVTFSFARDRAPLAERIFANGELVRAAVSDELRYFEKAEGNSAGKISELYDIQVVISNSTLPRAPATSWYLHCRTRDGIELKQDGFRIRFEDLDHWDLDIPAFLHPEF